MNKVIMTALLFVFCSASTAGENDGVGGKSNQNLFCQVFKLSCSKTKELVEPDPKDRITPGLALVTVSSSSDLPRDRNNVQNPIPQEHLNPADDPGFF